MRVIEVLSRPGIIAECRDEDAGQFVYAQRGDRSIELSWDGVGVFIEMFEAPSKDSVRDEQQDSFEIGAERAVAWLMRAE